MATEEKMSALDQGLFVLFSIILIVFFAFLFFTDFDPPRHAPPRTAAWARADAETLALAWAKAHYYLKAGYTVACHDDGAHPISQCIVYLNAQGHRSEIMLDCVVGPMAPHGCEPIKTE
jgi:hypothetical protein